MANHNIKENKLKLPVERVLVYPFDKGLKRCSCDGEEPEKCAGKHPIGGPAAVVDDAEKIQQHIDGGGGLGIPIRNFICIDVDPKNGGLESLDELVKILGPLPGATPRVLTGSGGYHIYLEKGEWPKGNLNTFAPGVEIKVNGFLVCPPSPHLSGETYKWERGPENELCPAPDEWALAFKNASKIGVDETGARPTQASLPPTEDRIAWARRALDKMEGSIAGAAGHTAAFRAAVVVTRGYCLEQADAAKIFDEVFNPKCIDGKTGDNYPWSEKDIQHKITDAENKSRAPWGFALKFSARDEWDLRLTAKGQVVKDAENLRQIFKCAAELQGIWHNQRSDMVFVKLPAEVRDREGDEQPRPVTDVDINCIQTWIIRKVGCEFSKESVNDAILRAASDRPFDDLKDWLTTITWDGTPRLGSWLIDLFGADDTPANREIGEVWLKGAVARVLDPGVQFDYAMILEGEQGVGKTSALRILGGEYHIETNLELDRKGEDEIARKLHSEQCWIVEMGELTALRKSEVETLKSFLTKKSDSFRRPYAKNVTHRKRSFVFAGTTNDSTYLIDTSNRRYLPVRVGQLNFEEMIKNRGQLLAEAVQSYRDNKRLVIAPEVMADLNTGRELRRIVGPEEEIIRGLVETRSVIRIDDAARAVFGYDHVSKSTMAFSRRVGGYLRDEGFKQMMADAGASGQRRQVRVWAREYMESKKGSEVWAAYVEECGSANDVEGSAAAKI